MGVGMVRSYVAIRLPFCADCDFVIFYGLTLFLIFICTNALFISFRIIIRDVNI